VSLAAVRELQIPLAASAADPIARLGPLEKEPQSGEPEQLLMSRLQKRRPAQMTERLSSLDVKRYNNNSRRRSRSGFETCRRAPSKREGSKLFCCT
jgi:hypothetical protein